MNIERYEHFAKPQMNALFSSKNTFILLFYCWNMHTAPDRLEPFSNRFGLNNSKFLIDNLSDILSLRNKNRFSRRCFDLVYWFSPTLKQHLISIMIKQPAFRLQYSSEVYPLWRKNFSLIHWCPGRGPCVGVSLWIFIS